MGNNADSSTTNDEVIRSEFVRRDVAGALKDYEKGREDEVIGIGEYPGGMTRTGRCQKRSGLRNFLFESKYPMQYSFLKHNDSRHI